MVSCMTKLSIGFVGGMDGIKLPVTGWTINRHLDKCCAVFAEDLSEENVIRLATTASQKDVTSAGSSWCYTVLFLSTMVKSKEWLAVHNCVVEHEEEPEILQAMTCTVYQRDFRRPSDLKKILERQKPVQYQRREVQCERCQHWFKSTGGLAVHKASCTVHT